MASTTIVEQESLPITKRSEENLDENRKPECVDGDDDISQERGDVNKEAIHKGDEDPNEISNQCAIEDD